MKKYIIPVFCVFAFLCDAQAAVKVKNDTANRYVETKGDSIDADEAADIETLENDIRILDEEIAKCQKQKKGWIAATVIGAAGVVATGTAAAVQGAKLKEQKDEYNTKKSEYDSLSDTLNSKQKELKKLNGEN